MVQRQMIYEFSQERCNVRPADSYKKTHKKKDGDVVPHLCAFLNPDEFQIQFAGDARGSWFRHPDTAQAWTGNHNAATPTGSTKSPKTCHLRDRQMTHPVKDATATFKRMLHAVLRHPFVMLVGIVPDTGNNHFLHPDAVRWRVADDAAMLGRSGRELKKSSKVERSSDLKKYPRPVSRVPWLVPCDEHNSAMAQSSHHEAHPVMRLSRPSYTHSPAA